MTCWLCGFETTELVTNSQIPSCKNGPCPICIAVANIDEEINQAVATLQRLIAKRYDLRSEQNHAHDPMHRLPLELRNHIFGMVLPKQDRWGEIVERTASRIVMPSRLASICRNWRDVALSNPSLWSTIRITLPVKQDTSELYFVQQWILRSRTSPLTLRIDANDASEKVWGRILDVIRPSSNRWQSLSFSGPRRLVPASHLGTFHYDRLRRLQITTYGRMTEPVTFLNTKMSPEEIYISDLSFDELQISWNHLTSATVEDLRLEDVAQLFRHAPRMTYCHIDTFGDRAAEDFSTPPIIHQSLKVLRLSYVHDADGAILFGFLALPYLQEIHTDGRLLHPWPGVTELVLTLWDVHSIGPLKHLLEEEYFPNLRNLTLQLQPFLFLWNNGFIRKLLDRKGPRPDSPNEGRLHKLLVVDEDRASDEFHDKVWNRDVGKQLKAFNIRLREDGFEILSQNTQQDLHWPVALASWTPITTWD